MLLGHCIKVNYEGEETGSHRLQCRSPGGEHCRPLLYSCLENPHGQRSLVGKSPRGSQGVKARLKRLSMHKGTRWNKQPEKTAR